MTLGAMRRADRVTQRKVATNDAVSPNLRVRVDDLRRNGASKRWFQRRATVEVSRKGAGERRSDDAVHCLAVVLAVETRIAFAVRPVGRCRTQTTPHPDETS